MIFFQNYVNPTEKYKQNRQTYEICSITINIIPIFILTQKPTFSKILGVNNQQENHPHLSAF